MKRWLRFWPNLSKLTLPALLGASTAQTFFLPWLTQILVLAWFFLQLARMPAGQHKQSFALSWAFVFGWMLGHVYWLFIAMHRFGDMPAPLAAIATVLFALFIASSPALVMLLASKLRRHATPSHYALLILPACWALGEWLRGWLLTGFPWAATGYAHVDGALSGFFPLIGIFGISWLAALAASLLSITVLHTQHKIKYAALAACAAILASGTALQQIEWTHTVGTPLKVHLLQGNISQDSKFVSERVIDSLQLYQRMITQEGADLIATPETAFPTFMHMLPLDYVKGLSTFAQQSNSHLLLGVPVADGQEHYTNSVVGISPQADSKFYRYDKHQLVPFGEFIPPGFRWFVDLMRIPLGDFAAGPALQQPFAVKDVWVMPNICYEDLFGEQIAIQLGENYAQNKPVANILLNVSNLAWYGQSSAIAQHLQISRARALETGRTMLRATNTGATAIITPKGVVSHLLPYDQAGIIRAEVRGYTGNTPYVLFRNLPFLILVSLALLLGGWFGRKRH